MVTRKPSARPESRVRSDIRFKKTPLSERLAYLTPEYVDSFIAGQAMRGDFRPLIESLLLDETIGPKTRGFLIRDFAGEVPRKRGQKAIWEQAGSDSTLYLKICFAMIDNQISKTAAISLVAEKAGKPLETVKSAFARTIPLLQDWAPVPIKINGHYRWPHLPEDTSG